MAGALTKWIVAPPLTSWKLMPAFAPVTVSETPLDKARSPNVAVERVSAARVVVAVTETWVSGRLIGWRSMLPPV